MTEYILDVPATLRFKIRAVDEAAARAALDAVSGSLFLEEQILDNVLLDLAVVEGDAVCIAAIPVRWPNL
jgi:hypothetical protein